MTYKLLGANVSPFVRKVRVLLAEKGIAYDFEPVSPFAPPPNWRDVSPLGKIPAFMDGDKVVNDSTVICQYIERKNKAVPMLPADDDGYIRALWLEEYIDGGFVPVAGAKVFFPLIVAPLRSKRRPMPPRAPTPPGRRRRTARVLGLHGSAARRPAVLRQRHADARRHRHRLDARQPAACASPGRRRALPETGGVHAAHVRAAELQGADRGRSADVDAEERLSGAERGGGARRRHGFQVGVGTRR
ncbi:MAG: glutathione S-transferase N-terminal domain-containing protein [Proteobacteria bacterium]|nr:glutathione S-transferase N-terminal domain-containing protein [Pseudomonadota bacterium]